jgi:proline dehydrogenase
MSNPVPDFQNTEIAFKHLKDSDLFRAWSLFRAINIKPLVALGPSMVTGALKLRLPVKGLVKSTVFRQFCGGETLENCEDTVKSLKLGGVYSILDYGVEGEKTEAGFDAAMAEVLRTVSAMKANPGAPFCVFKLTAMARFELLEAVSASGAGSVPANLKDEWKRVTARVAKICDKAIAAGKLVMIDAEETWIQPAIDHLALAMAQKHNKGTAKIYTTIQMYRVNGLQDVKELLESARSEGWIPGIKLVRGAYMEKERERATAMGYPSPIHPDKDSTDKAYDDALKIILAAQSDAYLCAGTHNATSSLLAVELVGKCKLPPASPRVWFAQLLGMSDDLTFNLAHSGYLAAKYVPYGPIAAVLPYLFRRARENTSIAGQSSRELRLIEKELRRRSGR